MRRGALFALLVLLVAIDVRASAQHTGGSFGGGSFGGSSGGSTSRSSSSSSSDHHEADRRQRERDRAERRAERRSRARGGGGGGGGESTPSPYESHGQPELTEAERALLPYVSWEELSEWTFGGLFAISFVGGVAWTFRRRRRPARRT